MLEISTYPNSQGSEWKQGLLNISRKKARLCPKGFQYQKPTGMIKKVIQQGRSDFDARSVLPVREHDKMARTPLVAFFNISKHGKICTHFLLQQDISI